MTDPEVCSELLAMSCEKGFSVPKLVQAAFAVHILQWAGPDGWTHQAGRGIKKKVRQVRAVLRGHQEWKDQNGTSASGRPIKLKPGAGRWTWYHRTRVCLPMELYSRHAQNRELQLTWMAHDRVRSSYQWRRRSILPSGSNLNKVSAVGS